MSIKQNRNAFNEAVQNDGKPAVRQAIMLPTPDGDIEIVSFHNLYDTGEHVALVFGDAETQEAPIVRVHSACFTGDLLQSLRCDCGNQLQEAMALFREKGGILLYMQQEGRGIGLYTKLDAYALQMKEGMDTFEANRALGFEDDERSFVPAAQMLQALGISKIRLLTNNPEKATHLKEQGVEIVQEMRTVVACNDHNKDYLQSKKKHSHHKIDLTAIPAHRKG